MERYLEIFVAGYEGYARYLWHEITHPHWKNYFYWLIGVSAFFFLLELTAPWRRDQAKFRKDFWLDFFYMFFNFFLFSLVIYNAAGRATEAAPTPARSRPRSPPGCVRRPASVALPAA